MKIAISGKMCSGKSTIAKLIKEYDNRYEIYSFGKKVKLIANELFGMDLEDKDRTLLIQIASKLREIDINVWANYIINQTKDKEYCIIDDLRFQNEFLIAKKYVYLAGPFSFARKLGRIVIAFSWEMLRKKTQVVVFKIQDIFNKKK